MRDRDIMAELEVEYLADLADAFSEEATDLREQIFTCEDQYSMDRLLFLEKMLMSIKKLTSE